ncbi:MAG: PAS domain-containing protein, partial [Massilia sp.]
LRGPEYVFESVNERFVHLVGERELVGLSLLAALPELAWQGFVELLDSVHREGRPVEGSNVRLQLRRSEVLEERYIDFVFMALPAGGAYPAGVLVHGVDITERTRANLLAVGQRSALELAVSDAPLDDVLDVLAHTAEEHAGGVGLAAVQLIEAGANGARARLRHAAGPSLPLEFMDALDAMPIGPQPCPGGAAAYWAETVTVSDMAADTRWDAYRTLAREHGLWSCRCIPIMSPAGAVLGVFSWYCREPRLGLAHEHAALSLLANTASLVIGQRHEAQERQAAEDRSLNILESISDGFLAVDPDWRVTYANAAAEKLVLSDRSEMVGKSLWTIFPGALGNEIEAALRHTAREREGAKFEVFYAPSARWVEINTCPTPDGGIALYFRDRTERRRSEEGIRRLAAVAEQSSDFIAITGPDARGVFVNPAGRTLCGIGADDDVGALSMLDFFAPEQRAFASEVILPALAGAAASWEGEMRFQQRASGAAIPVYFKGFAVRSDKGKIIGLATVTRDITAQKQAEDALRRVAADLSEVDHRKSEFLATLAHELRNPLAPIRTGLELIRRAPGDAAAIDRVHKMMERQVGHLVHLVNDLLDVARITSGKIELRRAPVELASLVAMAVETSAALIDAGALRLELQLAPQALVLEADAIRIVQVLSNLLNNAAKYTPAGGRITLSAWREGDAAVLTVADSGVGIPAEALGTLFDMFTQVRGNLDRAQGGLGIGLSLVRRLVELHGGSVAAASAGLGLGSTFTVRLPLARERSADDEAAGGALKVLVVDDNADAAGNLAELLGQLGHEARVALDGAEGISLAQAFAPDLVFIDIGMPGMNGHELARAIRRDPALRRARLVALSGYGAGPDPVQARQAGFDDYLVKPVDTGQLRQLCAAASGSDA